jgi:hypothetical protein
MPPRMRLHVSDIEEKVLRVDITPAEFDDGTWHSKLQNLSAREAKKVLTEDEWIFAATTTSMEGVHYDLYQIREEEAE